MITSRRKHGLSVHTKKKRFDLTPICQAAACTFWMWACVRILVPCLPHTLTPGSTHKSYDTTNRHPSHPPTWPPHTDISIEMSLVSCGSQCNLLSVTACRPHRPPTWPPHGRIGSGGCSGAQGRCGRGPSQTLTVLPAWTRHVISCRVISGKRQHHLDAATRDMALYIEKPSNDAYAPKCKAYNLN